MLYHARAPVRVDPAGGGTDAPPFCVDYGGDVVNFTIQRHVFASVCRLEKGSGIALIAQDLDESVGADSIESLPPDKLTFLQAFIRRLVPADESVLLITQSDIPASSGMGGSGALGVAVVAALDRAFKVERSPYETASLANDIERIDLGQAGGDQDSMGAALGGFNHLEYRQGDGKTIAHRVDVEDGLRLTIERDSLLIYTGEAHLSGSIHEDIKASYAQENSPTVAAMQELRTSAREMVRALQEGSLDSYTACMNRACDNLYRLHPSCDSDSHQELCKELDPYILSRKTCGAGGGGFILVHANPGCRFECKQRAEARGALVWPVTIDFAGVRSWEGAPLDPEELESMLHSCRA